MSHSVNIVYYTWINTDRDWKVIINGQLNDIKISGILEVSKLYIIISNENENVLDEALLLINDSLKEIDINKYNIQRTTINFYEYYGIKVLYELAKIEPYNLFIYLHTKGMFHWYNNNNNIRTNHEVYLTQNTIYLWRDILKVFRENEKISRLGMFPSVGGWIWFNFYWVKGSYLLTCEDPKITNDRYYYESWLGSGNTQNTITHCICNEDKKYTAEEAIAAINIV